jgi:hypothetical protein
MAATRAAMSMKSMKVMKAMKKTKKHHMHLAGEEIDLIRDIASPRKNGTPMDALAAVTKARRERGQPNISKSAIYRFLNCDTHSATRVAETRGQPCRLTKLAKLRLRQARTRLIKAADGEYQVTYRDIIEASSVPDMPCQRVVEDFFRAEGVSFRVPRKKICISEKDAKARLETCREWSKHRASFWTDSVHCYVDNKAFPMPLTPTDRSRYNKMRVKGHLRLKAEGTDRGFTKPRERHTFLGVPSVNIAAAVSKGRVIMWHATGKWNGAAAAGMYEGPLCAALRRTYGRLPQYLIVEDGDPKGNQSNTGLDAKKRAGIKAMTLPPRTPSLMPLDYAIWQRIDTLMVEGAPDGTEARADFLARLESVARSLPKSFVGRVVARMKKNVEAIVDAGGYIPKND